MSKSYGTNKRKEGGVPPSFLPDLKKSVDVFTLCVIFYISEIDFQVFFLCTKNQYSRNISNRREFSVPARENLKPNSKYACEAGISNT